MEDTISEGTSLGRGHDVGADVGMVVSAGIFGPLLLELESSVLIALFLVVFESSLSFRRLLLDVVKKVILR